MTFIIHWVGAHYTLKWLLLPKMHPGKGMTRNLINFLIEYDVRERV